MKKAIVTDRNFLVSDVDQRLYGSFIEHLGRAVYEGIYQPDSPFAVKRASKRRTGSGEGAAGSSGAFLREGISCRDITGEGVRQKAKTPSGSYWHGR